MLILAEKPSVAKEFADALNINLSKGFYSNSDSTIVICNCVGHLFSLEEPSFYSNDLPIIPERFEYRINPETEIQTKLVMKLLNSHRNDEILIATDADREGEVIARECLQQARINNHSKIKRFWVSQALTKDVILDGIKKAKSLEEYDNLAYQGFSRQHADWLVGMNFSRYVSNLAKQKLPVGRVQTAILSAVDFRCSEIENFVSKKYYVYYGIFKPSRVGRESVESCRGLYFELLNDSQNSSFSKDFTGMLTKSIGLAAKLVDTKNKKIIEKAPELYNLNALQKDAFRKFGYSAEMTLEIVQSLYEDLKCVSYPRTPSRVMGSGNVELCKNVYDVLSSEYEKFRILFSVADISLNNKRCFNDKKLEAHHALIPLNILPSSASLEQKNIYNMILEQFFLAFLPEYVYKKTDYFLQVDTLHFKVTGRNTIKGGWKDYLSLCSYFSNRHVSVDENDNENDESEEQNLDNIDWNNLYLTNIETKEKWTKAPPYFNEASILAFMENPKKIKVDDEDNRKLVGLGTPATRHTFIPKLLKFNYVEVKNKNIVVTDKGKCLLQAIRNSNISTLADIESTTMWEEQLEKNPLQFEFDIRKFVKSSIAKSDINLSSLPKNNFSEQIKCPVCGKDVRKCKSNWYCTGYKDGCKVVLCDKVAGAKLTEKDVINLCSGKKTGVKHCEGKTGKAFDCKFELDEENKIRFIFGGNK